MKHLQINKIFYNVKNLLFFLTATVCHVSPCGSQQMFCMTGRITSFSNTNMTPLQLETAAVLECTWPACAQNRFMPFNAEAKPPSFFSPASPPVMVAVSQRCLHLIRVSMSITPVLKNTLGGAWNKDKGEGKWVKRERERGKIWGKGET